MLCIMGTQIIVGIIALTGASIFGLVAAISNLEMIEQVNQKLPTEEQFAALGWYLSKQQRLRREYQRLYPSGRLLFKVRLLTAFMFACLIICAWGFGFFA